jgi:quercetin dioxygenase-like cupin family protein
MRALLDSTVNVARAAAPVTSIKCVENIYIREMRFEKAGDVMPGHRHVWAHPTILAVGALRLEVEGRPPRDLVAPCVIYIGKDKEHKLTALVDGTFAYCVHALRYGDQVGDIIDPEDYPAGANLLDWAKPLVKG